MGRTIRKEEAAIRKNILTRLERSFGRIAASSFHHIPKKLVIPKTHPPFELLKSNGYKVDELREILKLTAIG